MKKWDDKVVERLKELWPTHSGAIVAEMINREFKLQLSRNAVIGKAERLGLARKPSPLGKAYHTHYRCASVNHQSAPLVKARVAENRSVVNSSRGPWSDESIARLRELWPTNIAVQIAATLYQEFNRPFTRESVVSKAHRLKLQVKASPVRKSTKTLEQYPTSSNVIAFSTGPTTYDPSRTGVPLLSLDPHGCRWPVSHSRPHRFCGEAVDSGSYCPEHRARAVPMVFAEAAE